MRRLTRLLRILRYEAEGSTVVVYKLQKRKLIINEFVVERKIQKSLSCFCYCFNKALKTTQIKHL